MINLHAILGCRNLSRVFTMRKPVRRSYVVCLECGREYEYSLERMEIVWEIRPQVIVRDSVAIARGAK